MIQIAMTQLWVHDQDAARDFYCDQLGWEVKEDSTLAELGGFRWLTVGPAEQEVSVALLAVPGPPMVDADTAEQIRSLMGKGKAGTVFLTTEDVHADYEHLRARGVDFYQPPTVMPYGIDAGLRDPSGNMLRLAQLGAPTPA